LRILKKKKFVTLRGIKKNYILIFADAYTTSTRVKSWRLTLWIANK